MLGFAAATGVAAAVFTPTLRGGEAAAAGMKTYALAEQDVARAAVSREWGGHTNGRIPTSAMTQVSAATGSPYLRPDAAVSYDQLNAAFSSAFGRTLAITEAYRTYDLQYSYFTSRYSRVSSATNIFFEGSYWALRQGQSPAAVPGTSNHGWGVAADFGAGVASYGTAQKNWMNANAPAYGWEPTGDSFSPREPWHFDFVRPWNGTPTTPEEAEHLMSNGESYTIYKRAGSGRHFAACSGRYVPIGGALTQQTGIDGQRVIDLLVADGAKFRELSPADYDSLNVLYAVVAEKAAAQS
jgi:LAS superfamily LD-carboxypeptidase LdcB